MALLQDQVNLEIHEGVGKESNKPYKCLKVTIGEYETLIFPTKIELRYIKQVLNDEIDFDEE